MIQIKFKLRMVPLLVVIVLVQLLTSSFTCNTRQINKFDTIKGYVIDGKTGERLSNCKVLLLKWYKNTSYDITYKDFQSIADSSGVFSIHIGDNKFEYIQIAIQKEGYYPNRRLLKNADDFTKENKFSLEPCAILKTDNFVIIDNNDEKDLNFYPRLKIRFYKKNNQVFKKESFGYSLENRTLTSNLANADIWIDTTTKNESSIIITTANKDGLGICTTDNIDEPDFNIFMNPHGVKEQDIQYRNSFTIEDDKSVMLFIKSRKGHLFSKFMRIGALNEKSSNAEDGIEIVELELEFNVIIGHDGFMTLGFCSEIDLRKYLVSPPYR